MSTVEILSEIHKLSPADRREIAQLIAQLDKDATSSPDEIGAQPVRPSFADRYRAFLGVADDLPPDLAQNLDHYLHGHPKR